METSKNPRSRFNTSLYRQVIAPHDARGVYVLSSSPIEPVADPEYVINLVEGAHPKWLERRTLGFGV